MNRLTRWLPIICLAFVAPPVGAAVLVETLEWVVADADLVVRGTITEHDRVRDRDKEDVIWSTVTIKVAETIKGEKKDEIKFVARHTSRFISDRMLDAGKDKKEAVFCLVKSERCKDKGADYAGQPWSLRVHEGEIDQTVLDLSGESGAFYLSLDGRILTKKDDILKAVSAIATAKMPTQGRLKAPSPAEVAHKLGNGGPVFLLVPLGDRFEAVAKEWLKAKEIDFRVEGVKALRNFKTDANIQLLKGLLDDPQSKMDGKIKAYPVRLAAYDVLKQWKVDVPKPVTEESKD